MGLPLEHKKHKISKQIDFSVFDYFTDGFYAINKKWQYIYVNRQGAILAQMSPKELLGKRPQDIFPYAHKIDFGKAVRAVMREHKSQTIEAYYSRYNKWYENLVFPIPEGVGILARDITKRKQAEEDQARLAAIVTSSDDAIISKDLTSKIISWNEGAEKIFGYHADEMIGKSIRTIIPSKLQKEEDIIIAKLKKGQRIEHFRTIRMTKDGRKIAVSLMISPIKDAKGKVIGASQIAQDITAIKHYEDNLRFLAASSKELNKSLEYEKTLNNIAKLAVPDIADWCSIDMLNPLGYLEQVALAHKDPEKIKWAKELRKKSPPRMDVAIGIPHVLRTGKPEFLPYIDEKLLMQNTQNETERELIKKLQLSSIIIVPIFRQRKPVGAITFVTTESRRKYTQNDLSIAQEVGHRASLAIENSLLYKATQKELIERKKLEKQKDEFIAVASHELKTPVTSIKSFAQLLHYRMKKEGRLHDAELLGKLDAQIDKLTSLIGDLLDVTKIEGGRLMFTETAFDFDELIDEIIEEMQRTTDRHALIRVGKAGKTVVGDRERLGQVLTNLISNAIKYSPSAEKILIHTTQDKKNIKVCVQDFGVGILRDKLDKVFDRFFRVSGPNQETFPGLGLGLYISNEIVKRWKGKIWVESIEGKGSTFCFTFPIK